ncbi:MAG TPA: hypothetical protein VGG24_20085 [Paraburkholderia sp.]|jgi:hypothetical protein
MDTIRDGWPAFAHRALIVAAVLAFTAGHAWAQADSSPASAAAPKKRVCVDVEVNGATALSYDCLSQQLAPTPSPADAASGASNAATGLATAPSNKVGTFNYSGESIRFGSNWGKSVTPQRPAPVPVVPLR